MHSLLLSVEMSKRKGRPCVRACEGKGGRAGWWEEACRVCVCVLDSRFECCVPACSTFSRVSGVRARGHGRCGATEPRTPCYRHCLGYGVMQRFSHFLSVSW